MGPRLVPDVQKVTGFETQPVVRSQPGDDSRVAKRVKGFGVTDVIQGGIGTGDGKKNHAESQLEVIVHAETAESLGRSEG
jgi:hypothetical protein